MSVSGPLFLVFYLMIAVGANLWLRWFYRAQETGGRLPRLEFSEDPYRLACLRGGVQEAIDVAVFSLLDRGLIREEAGVFKPERGDAAQIVRRPLEKAVVACVRPGVSLADIRRDKAARQAVADYEYDLGARKLLASERIKAARFPALFATLGVTLGIAGARIWQSLAHGHTNLLFLIIMAVVCAGALIRAYRKRITALGVATLAKIESLYAKLRRETGELRPGGQTNAVVLLAAVYGFSAVPEAQFPYVKRLFVPPKSDSSGDGSGGSSDSDSGGDGGGGCGGCGGGGCG